MRLLCPCFECGGIPPHVEVVEYIPDEKFSFFHTCENGHERFFLLQVERFELLFEEACQVYFRKQYDSAIMRFSVSVERVYEFYALVVSVANGYTEEKFYNEIWTKKVRLRSHNQIDAYKKIFEQNEGELAPKFESAERILRNRVAHDGFLPSVEEAWRYGEKAFSIIKTIICIVKRKYHEAMIKVIEFHNREKAKENTQGLATISIALSIGASIISDGDWLEVSFESVLKNVEKWLSFEKDFDKTVESLNEIRKSVEAKNKISIKGKKLEHIN